MLNKKIPFFTVTLLSLGFSTSYGQGVLDAAGGDASGSGGQVNYSVGQVFYTLVTSGGGSMQQGIQAIVLDQVLPVTLLNFELKKQPDNSVLLSWQTAMEKDNDFFIIEKSTDGKSFKEFARVKGKGNSNSITGYTAYDLFPAAGINYYRLKQRDYDGAISYSAIKMLKISFPENTITLSPNPTSGILTLQTDASVSRTYQIIGLNGSLLESKPITSNRMQININHLAPATYIIKIMQENKTLQSFKITKN